MAERFNKQQQCVTVEKVVGHGASPPSGAFLLIVWGRSRSLEPGPEWILFGTVDIELFGEVKVWDKTVARPHVFEAIEDLTVVAVLLMTELVAWKSKDCEALGAVSRLQLVHGCVVGFGRALVTGKMEVSISLMVGK